MIRTTEQKLAEVLGDNRLKFNQKELINSWYKHISKSQPAERILERAYTIREFGLFIAKPYQDACAIDVKRYLEYKLKEKDKSVTDYKTKAVKGQSADCYKFRIRGFYRWLLKHTPLQIDNEVAYPQPKLVRKEEISKEERCNKAVSALLSNTIICVREKGDKNFNQEQLKKKYANLLLKEHNLKTLNDYYNYKITSGAVQSHIGFIGKLHLLKRLGLFLDEKIFKQATREDIQNFLKTIQHNNGNINPSYKAHLLDFYRYVYEMFGNEQPRKYPDVVSWLYQGRKKINDRLAKAIIPDNEVKAMLEACSEQRDRAIISILRDSSARVGELINLCIKDVNITDISSKNSEYQHQIATIKLKGKTGERINQLFWSVSDLRLWLLNHPLKNEPDAPLFIATKECRYGQRLSAVGINKALQRAAKKAEIKRHIHAHLFRHTNLTKMAQVLSESELKIHAGWGANSNMASVYVHLSADDVNRKILKSLGIQLEDDKPETTDELLPRICPNNVCSYQNPSDAKFCLKCGYPMTLKTAVDLRKIKDQEEELHKKIMNKGTDWIDMSKVTDIKEMIYQIVKKNPELLEKLREIAGKVDEN